MFGQNGYKVAFVVTHDSNLLLRRLEILAEKLFAIKQYSTASPRLLRHIDVLRYLYHVNEIVTELANVTLLHGMA